MKQILLVPDSFKGTLTSRQVCETMAEQLHLVFPEADITSLPVADGGEGSVEAFLEAVGGRRVNVTVTGPFGEPVESFYGILQDGETAVIEMAACAGLPMVEGRLDPEKATTYGVGELILAAKKAGVKTVILPKQNEKDLQEISDEIKEGLEFVLAKEMDDVLKHALAKGESVWK